MMIGDIGVVWADGDDRKEVLVTPEIPLKGDFPFNYYYYTPYDVRRRDGWTFQGWKWWIEEKERVNL